MPRPPLAALPLAALLFAAAPPSGGLYVTTLPAGADVWLDGTYVGRSPVVVDGLAPGRHGIALSKTGWSPQSVDVAVVAGQTSVASEPLRRALRAGTEERGTLALLGEPIRELRVDGVRAPHERELALAAGGHEIEVTTAAGRLTRSVTIYPGTRTDLVVRTDDGTAVRSIVVAPALDYLDAGEVRVEGDRVVLRHGAHEALGRVGSSAYRLDGRPVTYDSAPTLVAGRLYLPLDLLNALTAEKPRP